MIVRGKNDRPTITAQQVLVSDNGLLDLASGYPLVETSDSIRHLFELAALDIQSFFGISDANLIVVAKMNAHRRLVQSVRRILFSDHEAHFLVRCLVTGSLAIDRALSATARYAARRRKSSVSLFGASPAFDMPLLAVSEKKGMKFNAISAIDDVSRFPLDAIMRAASQVDSDSLGAILLSSPENPTGNILSKDELSRLSEFCIDRKFILIIDHCFLHAGVHKCDSVTPIWAIAPRHLDMIAIWDTGKLIGVGGHKFGFVITNSGEIDACIAEAIQVLQYELPLLDMFFFIRLLESNAFQSEVVRFRGICQENLAWVRSDGPAIGSYLVEPAGGSTALIDVSRSGYGDLEFQEEVARRGVGVVAGRAFFHQKEPESRFVRISLARDPAYFRKAAGIVNEALRTETPGQVV